MKAFGSQANFIDITIRVMFNMKNLSVANNVVIRLRWNQIPCSISQESIELISHGLMPLWGFKGLGDIGGFKGWRERIFRDSIEMFGFEDTTPGSGLLGVST